MELQKKTAANLQHVLTQDPELTPVLATKDILEMEKHVKVRQVVWVLKNIIITVLFFPIFKDADVIFD